MFLLGKDAYTELTQPKARNWAVDTGVGYSYTGDASQQVHCTVAASEGSNKSFCKGHLRFILGAVLNFLKRERM